MSNLSNSLCCKVIQESILAIEFLKMIIMVVSICVLCHQNKRIGMLYNLKIYLANCLAELSVVIIAAILTIKTKDRSWVALSLVFAGFLANITVSLYETNNLYGERGEVLIKSKMGAFLRSPSMTLILWAI